MDLWHPHIDDLALAYEKYGWAGHLALASVAALVAGDVLLAVREPVAGIAVMALAGALAVAAAGVAWWRLHEARQAETRELAAEIDEYNRTGRLP